MAEESKRRRPDNRLAYWRGFRDYLRETGNDDIVLVTHSGGHTYFRIIRIEGVSEPNRLFWELPHLAVVATKRGNKKKQRRAGNRVQLVLPQRQFYERLLKHRSNIAAQIPGALWVPPDEGGETGHVEVWKQHNLNDPDVWDEDFAWLVCNLRVFQRVLGDYVRKMLR